MRENVNEGSFPQYYYDISLGHLLVGKVTVDEYIESGGHPADIYELSNLLIDKDIELPYQYKRKPERSTKELLDYGRWLAKVVHREFMRKNKKQLNESIIVRANRLGIFPSVWEVESHPEFGTLSSYYTKLNLYETKRIGIFNEWSQDDFIKYIKSIGHKPNRKEIYARSLENVNNPSPGVIVSRFGSLRAAYELAGYPDIHSWERNDYISWGVRVMQANGGIVPTQAGIDYLSKLGRGPSATTVVKHFDKKLINFQEIIEETYKLQAEENKHHLKQKGAEIQAALASGNIDLALFQGVTSGQEMIHRYAKFTTVRSLTSTITHNRLIHICKSRLADKDFFKLLVLEDASLSVEIVKNAARELGCFNDIWPMNDYMERLKIPDEKT